MRRAALVAGLVVAVACGGAASVPRVSTAPSNSIPADPLTLSCKRHGKIDIPQPTDSKQGSAVVLARSAKHTIAYVADGDSRSIHTVAVDDEKELGHTVLSSAPRQVIVLPDGRLVATLPDASRIAVLEPLDADGITLSVLCERGAPEEPVGVALSPDGETVAVTSGWGAALSTFDAASLDPKRVVSLPRDPHGVLIGDGDVAYVTHLVGAQISVVRLMNGEVSSIDLSMHKTTPLAQLEATRSKRSASHGYAIARVTLPSSDKAKSGAQRILAPMVSVDRGETSTTAYYGPPFDGVGKETPTVGVVDPDRKEAMSTTLFGTAEKPFTRECLLPRAALVRPDSPTLLVACYGIDAVLVLDALATDPIRAEKRRFSVPPGPEGLAFDEITKKLFVFSQLAGSLSVISLEAANATPKTIPLEYRPDPADPAVARGRQLFYRTDDARITDDGLGCASCHIDGRDDGITWTTPMGPRQTPMLAGRLQGAHPYGWEGDQPTIETYVAKTIRNLKGMGLDEASLKDIGAFLVATKGPNSAAPSNDVMKRGRELFTNGCESCHQAGRTDGSTHHISGPMAVDTPSLRFVRGTAPYFHDGRYSTLEALLGDLTSTMGNSAMLPPVDQAALAAYLRTL